MPEFIVQNPIPVAIVAYLVMISLFSVGICIYDKKVSKLGRVQLRIPESGLILFSIFGGSVAMLITMIAIRHKTKHKKFMIGIPAIIIVQAAITAAIIWLINR